MHLSPRQLDRFFDLLDALLVFANDRLQIVDRLDLPIVGEAAEMKAALVCDMLWGNREVIEEYVRANPDGLGRHDLEQVAGWADALAGEFTLVRHGSGQTLMMHETGVYAVGGLDRDLSERLTQAPDILHAVLLPFEGIIVTDGLEAGSGIPLDEAELKAMEEDFVRLKAQGIVWTADGLRARVREYNRRQRERELDELLASIEREARQSRDGEQLPEGFHRGALAGLSQEGRDKALYDHFAEIIASDESPGPDDADPAPSGDWPASGFPRDGAHPAGGFPGTGGPEGTAAPDRAEGLGGAEGLATSPYEDERDAIVLNCADALVQMCGLMTLKEAYEAYRSVVLDVVDLERFVAILMNEDAMELPEFALQEWNGQSYLMHFSISDAYARDWVARQQVGELGEAVSSGAAGGDATAAIDQVVKAVSGRIETELQGLGRYRSHLLECHARTQRRPLDPEAGDGGYLEGLAARPPVVQLRGFLDAHVPDDQDDYLYADQLVHELLLHSIDSGDAFAFIDEVDQAGLSACSEDEGLLPRLVENAYGALPSWEYNGWSPQEVMERVMGRKIFYNARGEMMHPAPGDPCPCGSGKPYGGCHG